MTPGPAERVFVAIGSNIEPRHTTIESGVAELARSPGVTLVALSRIRQTEPVGPVPQGPFLNAVIELRTDLTPPALLELLLRIEHLHGREREHRWGPRTLDLDIILFGSREVRLPGLTVPHPRFAERLFVLEPLADLAPELRPPGHDRTIAELAGALGSLASNRSGQ